MTPTSTINFDFFPFGCDSKHNIAPGRTLVLMSGFNREDFLRACAEGDAELAKRLRCRHVFSVHLKGCVTAAVHGHYELAAEFQCTVGWLRALKMAALACRSRGDDMTWAQELVPYMGEWKTSNGTFGSFLDIAHGLVDVPDQTFPDHCDPWIEK